MTNTATLTFATYSVTEAIWDTCKVFIKDATGTSNLVENAIWQASGVDDFWSQAMETIPAGGLGQQIRLEFLFESDISTTGPGWYIDDVRVGE